MDRPRAALDVLGTLFDATYFARRGVGEAAGLAARIVEHLAPARVLDVGCGRGELVAALRAQGVEASGVDGSRYALSQVPEAAAAHCAWADATELEADGDYDLLVCWELLEHLEQPERALERLTALAPRILFATSAEVGDDPSRCSVRALDTWVAAFGARGFGPDLSLDAALLAPGALLFVRGGPLEPAVGGLYAQGVLRARELAAEREALRASQARLAHTERQLEETRGVRDRLAAELAALRGSDGARIGQALRRAKEQVFPEGSGRHRAFVHARGWLLGQPVDPPQPPPPLTPPPVEPRVAFGARYLRGRGLEIGALHCPQPVPPGVEVRYVDRLTREQLVARYPELDPATLVTPSLLADGFHLADVPAGSEDFVIANHVLEHTPQPVQTLCAWSRVLRPGGVLLLAVPIAAECFDRYRELTSLVHLLSDHRLLQEEDRAALQARDLEHYRDWVLRALPAVAEDRGEPARQASDAELEAEARELQAQGEEIHFHTFSPGTVRRLLECVSAAVDPSLELLAVEPAGGEVLAALRKRA